MSLRVGGLFAGVGGIELGLSQVLDCHPAWWSEVDPAPSRVLAHRWPDVPNLGDITRIDWSAVEPVDIVTGGYPCQPFSHAGARKGTGDERHLWPYVVEALAVLRPPLCVFENVQGHLSLGFDVVLADLAILGYRVIWTLISASSVGAPHRRNRLFILAEDVHGQLCGRADRRGGVHRDQSHQGGEHVCDPGAGGDGDEGHPDPRADAITLRGPDRDPSARDGQERGEGRVAAGRAGGERVPVEDQTSSRTQGGSGRLRDRALARNPGQPVGARALPLERRPEASRPAPDAAGAGEQPERPATGVGAAGPEAGSGVPLGRMVGSGGGSFRAGAVPGADPLVGSDGRRARVRDELARVAVLAWSPADADGDGLESLRGVRPVGRDADRCRGAGQAAPVALLPTPAVNDMGAAYTPEQWDEWTARMRAAHGNGNGHGPSLHIEALRSGESWGPYAPAVRNWERVLGRSAPPPTEPTGKDGAPRLSARAVEFLMGLPDGWVTDVPGVTRNHALKALGNGCVPQQVAAAVAHLLEVRRTHALVA